MGWELGSKVRTVGAWMPAGRRRTTELTMDATWLAMAVASASTEKPRVTRLCPLELEEFMSVMPLIVETAFSITWVICWSMTAGVAPA